jgi:hypothetical protein
MYTSCTKDDSDKGTPKSGKNHETRIFCSLLIGAGQGQLVAIMGNNLQGATQVWFNDQQARLTPTYITSTSILVSIPSQIPITVTNKLKIIFKNGYVLLYDFQVQISKPLITAMASEFVKAGDTATIRGNNFYAPITVTFEGGATANILTLKDDQIQVKVPAGAQPGRIVITTSFGTTKSDFWFRDNRNLLITNDPWTGWWGQTNVVSGSDPMAISGNFTRMTANIGAWAWTEWIGGKEVHWRPSHYPTRRSRSGNTILKFEVNT